MPWWIWVVLAVFMLAMLVAGVVYAAWRGLCGLRTVGETGARLSEALAPLADEEPSAQPVPVFTEPLSQASERYTRTQADLIRRRQAKRERHARLWAQWNRR